MVRAESGWNGAKVGICSKKSSEPVMKGVAILFAAEFCSIKASPISVFLEVDINKMLGNCMLLFSVRSKWIC